MKAFRSLNFLALSTVAMFMAPFAHLASPMAGHVYRAPKRTRRRRGKTVGEPPTSRTSVRQLRRAIARGYEPPAISEREMRAHSWYRRPLAAKS